VLFSNSCRHAINIHAATLTFDTKKYLFSWSTWNSWCAKFTLQKYFFSFTWDWIWQIYCGFTDLQILRQITYTYIIWRTSRTTLGTKWAWVALKLKYNKRNQFWHWYDKNVINTLSVKRPPDMANEYRETFFVWLYGPKSLNDLCWKLKADLHYTQCLPKTVAYMYKSSTQLIYDYVSELHAWFTQYNNSNYKQWFIEI
jgi:hypothetical protein